VILVSGCGSSSFGSSQTGCTMPIPESPFRCTKQKEKCPDWIWTFQAAMKTDLNPIPFSPMYPCDPFLELFSDITDCPKVTFSEAIFITIDHNPIRIDLKGHKRCLSSCECLAVFVVFRVLEEFKDESSIAC